MVVACTKLRKVTSRFQLLSNLCLQKAGYETAIFLLVLFGGCLLRSRLSNRLLNEDEMRYVKPYLKRMRHSSAASRSTRVSSTRKSGRKHFWHGDSCSGETSQTTSVFFEAASCFFLRSQLLATFITSSSALPEATHAITELIPAIRDIQLRTAWLHRLL